MSPMYVRVTDVLWLSRCRGEKNGECEKEGNEKFYLSRVNNDTVIIQDVFFCRLNVVQINSATAVINKNGAVAS